MRTGITLYIKNTLSAVDFYHKAFGTTVGYNEKFPDGTYLHASLTADGNELFAISENQNDQIITGNTMQYGITFEGDRDAVTVAYNVLKEDCIALNSELGMFFWGSYGADILDKFGVRWYIADK